MLRCCIHDNPLDGQKVPCPQVGFCSRPSVSCNELIESPKYLFLQLLRFGLGHDGPKVSTLVKFGAEVRLSNGIEYETKAVISHWGNTLKEGHYVAHSKNESGEWWLLNDSSATLSSLTELNTKDNYILLLEKKFRAEDTRENVVIFTSTSSSELTSLHSSIQDKSDSAQSCTPSIGADVHCTPTLEPYSTQAPNPSFTAVLPPHIIKTQTCTPVLAASDKLVQPKKAVQVKTTGRKVGIEEVESLIISLEAIGNKTKAEKDELQKLKKKTAKP